MNKQYILRPTRVHVLPEGEPIFSEQATVVQIEDEAGGEYVQIFQSHDGPMSGIAINDEEEWNAISAAVADMFVEIGKRAPRDEALEQQRAADIAEFERIVKQGKEF